MRNRLLLANIILILFLQTGCLYAVRYDGEYHGKVVNEETREPIEGAVVLGTWAVYHFGVAGGYSTFYDARETVTDKNGEFTISGQGLRILSNVGPMGVLIYKAGYTYYEAGWDNLKISEFHNKQVKWEGEVPVFPLRRLSEEERKNDVTGTYLPSTNAPGKMIMQMIQEINREMIYRGLEPYQLAPSRVGEKK
jgi:hypothetical protein